MFLDFILNTKF